MKPKMPNRAGSDLNVIRRESWNSLLDCVDYAMEHPRGDGNTIQNMGNGILRTRRGGGGGGTGGGGAGMGMFTLVRKPAEEGVSEKVAVLDMSIPGNTTSAGVAHVNNQPHQVAAKEFDMPASGTLYIYLHLNAARTGSDAIELSDVEMDGSETIGTGITLALEGLEEPPRSSFAHTYYLVGRVTALDGTVAISQDHRPGNLYMLWFGEAVGIGEEVDNA